jgi:hypothetical protein
LKGLRAAVEAFWNAGIDEIYIDGSFFTEKPDPVNVDGYWVEPDLDVYDRVDPYWIDFAPVFVQAVGKWRWRMWASRCRVLYPRTDAGPRIDRLDEIAPFIVKLRIAKGVSQTELAHRLDVSKQVISRYEESDYQTVGVGRLQEILDAIGVKTAVTLRA